jgi:hypothetical protein
LLREVADSEGAMAVPLGNHMLAASGELIVLVTNRYPKASQIGNFGFFHDNEALSISN